MRCPQRATSISGSQLRRAMGSLGTAPEMKTFTLLDAARLPCYADAPSPRTTSG